jgi:hypothetical protein
VKRAQVRRSKLYYLRRKDFKISKLKTKDLDQFVTEEEKEAPAEKPSDEKEELKNKETEAKKEETLNKEKDQK